MKKIKFLSDSLLLGKGLERIRHSTKAIPSKGIAFVNKIKHTGKQIDDYLEQPLLSEKTVNKIKNDIRYPITAISGIKNMREKVKEVISPEIDPDNSNLCGGLVVKENVPYVVMEISPSQLTSNEKVKWLLAEISRMYRPLVDRISGHYDGISYYTDLSVWWEVYISQNHIRFYLVVPDKNNAKHVIERQVMKTWKQANVKTVPDYLPELPPDDTSITHLTLENHPVLSLDVQNPTYTPLDSILNAKYYLKDADIAILQIGIQPLGNDWNNEAKTIYSQIKETGSVPRKSGKPIEVKELLQQAGSMIGLISEELTNLLGDFVIPGWEENRELAESLKSRYGEVDTLSTQAKHRADAFKTTIRIVAVSESEERRKSIVRAISSGFDPLAGDNRLVEKRVSGKKIPDIISRVKQRKHNLFTPDVLGGPELAKMIQVPDKKAQIEHYNELSLNTTRSESEVPKTLFEDDRYGIPFCLYEDTDGQIKTCYFEGKDKDRLCMTRIVIGEPGSGKTTFAGNFAVDAFNRGYGGMAIDVADGKLIKQVLSAIPPELKHKVKVIDFTNSNLPIGLGWNEAFLNNPDIIEDLLVDEILTYIALVSGEELNMMSRQWVENAVKAVYTNPDAVIQDVKNMLNSAQYREKIIPTITDPQLRASWEYYHNKLTPKDRKAIYDQAFRRLGPVIDKKGIRNFILQRPKKDKNGEYVFNLRKWMDEGYLVLVKCTEALGETIQTALVSFLLAKYNLAIISREDMEEDDRHPCFLVLDEPDHYIKGSERWRRMLTRYRKYRCGLVMMFHGWEQLKEADRDLPKMMRKSGPHYIVYHTDLDNLAELKSVLEPEYKIVDLAKGMPEHHAVIRLNMFNRSGMPIAPFMAKGVMPVDKRYPVYDNDDLYGLSAKELGRPKEEVMEEIFRGNSDIEFMDISYDMNISAEGEGELDPDADKDTDQEDTKTKKGNRDSEEIDKEEKLEKDRLARIIMESQMEAYMEECKVKGQEVDLELIQHMDELLEEG